MKPALLALVLEHFAVAVSAVTGVLAARGKQVDLFGVLVLALVTALGGGTVRDWMLGDAPVMWIRDPNYLFTASVAGLVTFFIARHFENLRQSLLVADAFSLALFTIVGAQKAISFEVAPPIAVAMGVTTGVAGGILRDVLTGEIPLVFRRQIYLYATAALAGASLFVVLVNFCPGRSANDIVSIAVILVLRLAAIRWKLGLPVFEQAKDAP